MEVVEKGHEEVDMRVAGIVPGKDREDIADAGHGSSRGVVEVKEYVGVPAVPAKSVGPEEVVPGMEHTEMAVRMAEVRELRWNDFERKDKRDSLQHAMTIAQLELEECSTVVQRTARQMGSILHVAVSEVRADAVLVVLTGRSEEASRNEVAVDYMTD